MLMGTQAVERVSSDMSDSDAIRWDPDVHARRITRDFVVDAHEIVRRGVPELLNAEPDLTVVGEADAAGEALLRIPLTQPDVVIVDVWVSRRSRPGPLSRHPTALARHLLPRAGLRRG